MKILVSENSLKHIIGTIICCTGLAFGVVNAEDAAPAADVPAEDPSLWDKTKETSGEAWDATKEGSKKAWGATKEAFDSDTPEEEPAADNPQQ